MVTLAGRLVGACALTACAAASAVCQEPGQDELSHPSTVAKAAERRFHLGVAESDEVLAENADLVAASFASLTAENDMKWSVIEPARGQYDFAAADAIVALAEERGLRLRGHTLFWTRLNGLPDWFEPTVREAADPVGEARALMRRHAEAMLARYKGVEQWDAVNEPLEAYGGAMDEENFFYRTLGPGWVAEAFEIAHAADPEARLFLNETLVVNNQLKFLALVQLTRGLIEAGAPIDGVGLQGHFLVAAPDYDALRRQLSVIGAMGLDVELTEVDVPLYLFAGADDPLAAQAEAYAEVVRACLDVPACTGVTVWGLKDGDSWLDGVPETAALAPTRPLLFTDDLRPKPAYEAATRTIQQHLEATDQRR